MLLKITIPTLIVCFSSLCGMAQIVPGTNMVFNNSYFNPSCIGFFEKTSVGIRYSHQSLEGPGDQFRQVFVYNAIPGLVQKGIFGGLEYSSIEDSSQKATEYSFSYGISEPFRIETRRSRRVSGNSGTIYILVSLSYGSFSVKEAKKTILQF